MHFQCARPDQDKISFRRRSMLGTASIVRNSNQYCFVWIKPASSVDDEPCPPHLAADLDLAK